MQDKTVLEISNAAMNIYLIYSIIHLKIMKVNLCIFNMTLYIHIYLHNYHHKSHYEEIIIII